MPRAVIDTNVLISGIISERGAPSRVINMARDNRFTLVTSPTLIGEFISTSGHPHITGKYKQIIEQIDAIVNFLLLAAEVVDGIPKEKVIVDDPADDAVLACAIEGKAEFIVSGDSHLLNLKEYQGIKIVAAKQFLEILEAKGGSYA